MLIQYITGMFSSRDEVTRIVEFAQLVQKYIDEGYELTGPVQISAVHINESMFINYYIIQTLTKKEPE